MINLWIRGLKRRRAGGFTLLELLIVVAIMGILMGLILSVVQKARSSARGAKCASNLRQIFTSFGLYAGDNGGQVPINYEDALHGVETWDDALSAYDGRNYTADRIRAGTLFTTADQPKADYLYRCPEEYKNDTAGARVLMRTYTMPRVGAGFAGTFRHALYLDRWPEGMLIALATPAETILLCEVRGRQTRLGGSNGLIVDGPQVPVVGARQDQVGLGPLHGTKWNYLMADGHVEMLSEAETVGTGSTNSPRGLWTRAAHD